MSFGLGIVTETTGLVDEARREVVQTQCGSTPINLLAFKLIFKEYNIFFKKRASTDTEQNKSTSVF
jgi:hypothetical protein